MSDIFKALGITGLGVLGIMLFVALLFIIGTALTAFFVALIWNWLGLCSVFGLSPLSFWGVVAVAAGLNFVGGLFSRPQVTTGS